ncbi:MAG: hypothetical protein WC455_10035 [Dehalococcoidia bacterium]|jgi:hypothetical protein
MKRPDTDKVLVEMLTECTGSHFLDSGCFLGRHWQHNQGKVLQAFMTEPAESYRADITRDETLEFSGRISVFHYLRNILEYDTRMTKIYYAFDSKHQKESYTHTLKMWADKIEPHCHHSWGNSANSDCDLSQDVQFLDFEVKGQMFVALQIHGGCDLRGGYTKPRIFRADEMLGCWDFRGVACTSCRFEYDNWAWQHGKPIHAVEMEEPPVPFVPVLQPDLFEAKETPISNTYEHKGTAVVVDEVAYCPQCGNELVAC